MKNAEQFLKDLKENRELAEGLTEVLASAETEDEALEKIVGFANENGYEVRKEELNIKQSTELSDEELELVSGGGYLSRLKRWILLNIVGPENVIKI